MKNYLIVLLLSIISLTVLSIGINKPLNGHHDWNNRYFSKIAQNYISHGVISLKFGQLIGDNLPESKQFYTHHPQLFPLILAITVKFFGNDPWSIRLTPILFSTGTVCLFFLLLIRYHSQQSAFIACLFVIFSPMFAYFGKMANHEVYTLFFIVLTLSAYVNKQKKLTIFSLICAMWAGWPGYYLSAFLFLWSKKKRFLILPILSFLLFLLNVYTLTGSLTGGGLGEVLFFRMGFINLPHVVENYTNWQLLLQELRWSYRFFSPPVFLISVVMFARMIIKQKIDSVWLIFWGIAIIHVILFRTGAWRHDYWLYYFLPFFGWGMAIAAEKIKKWAYVLLVLSVYLSWPFFWALQTMVENTF